MRRACLLTQQGWPEFTVHSSPLMLKGCFIRVWLTSILFCWSCGPAVQEWRFGGWAPLVPASLRLDCALPGRESSLPDRPALPSPGPERVPRLVFTDWLNEGLPGVGSSPLWKVQEQADCTHPLPEGPQPWAVAPAPFPEGSLAPPPPPPSLEGA